MQPENYNIEEKASTPPDLSEESINVTSWINPQGSLYPINSDKTLIHASMTEDLEDRFSSQGIFNRLAIF